MYFIDYLCVRIRNLIDFILTLIWLNKDIEGSNGLHS